MSDPTTNTTTTFKNNKYFLIDIENALLLKNHQKLGVGKMDPFVTLEVSSGSSKLSSDYKEVARTPTHWDAHFEPVWFHACPCRIFIASTYQLKFTVHNDSKLGPKNRQEMGECIIETKALLKQYQDQVRHSKKGSLAVTEEEYMGGGDNTTDMNDQLMLSQQHTCCRLALPLSDNNGTLYIQVKLRQLEEAAAGISTPQTSTSPTMTRVNPNWFEAPVQRLGVSGGTAPFFQLTLTTEGMEATTQQPSYYIGKDLSHAEDEREFYEKILQLIADQEELHNGVGLLIPFLFAYLGVLETTTTEGTTCQLLVLQNLRHDYQEFRMMDLKLGHQTAQGGWQGKSRLAALKQSVLDGITNSIVEGYRLEGFDGSPPRVQSMDPLLDILATMQRAQDAATLDNDNNNNHTTDVKSSSKTTWGGHVVSETEAKKAKRIMLQTLTGADIFRLFIDVHQVEQIDNNTQQHNHHCMMPVQVAEIVLHELVRQLVRLAVTCHKVHVPQKWIGSSVALGFDCGLFPSLLAVDDQAEAEQAVRSKVITKVFDWGRSELLTLRKYKSMTATDQADRQRFWDNYREGLDRLAYNATREYYHRFTNTNGVWKEIELRVMDFDSMTHDDYMGQVIIPLPNLADAQALKALEETRPYELYAEEDGSNGNGKPTGTIYCSISWLELPSSSKRIHGMWQVHVERATGLPIMDPNGLSDPYCIVVARDGKGRRNLTQMTCVKARSLDPEWNETINIPVVKPRQSSALPKALGEEGLVLDFSPSPDVMDQEMARLFQFQEPPGVGGDELITEWSTYLRKAAA